MKYITVKLTEDQVTEIERLIGNEFEAMKEFHTTPEQASFLRRIKHTLAKAKS